MFSHKINIQGMARFNAQLRRELSSGGPMTSAFKVAGARYMGFVRQRFNRLSKSQGGGEWRKLARSTIMARRYGKKGGTIGGELISISDAMRRANTDKRKDAASRRLERVGRAIDRVAILRDTGLLLNSITNYEAVPLVDGIRVGSNLKYAKYHDLGGTNGRPPQRAIFVQPDAATTEGLRRSLEIGYQKSIDRLGGGFGGR